MAKHYEKPVTVESACKTLNEWGFHVRDQGDKLMCFHTTKMFDAVITVEDGVPDRIRFEEIIGRLKNNTSQPLRPATGEFKPAPEFSRPITVRDAARS